MSSYIRLNIQMRRSIEFYHTVKHFKLSKIAEILGVHRSTISREIKRGKEYKLPICEWKRFYPEKGKQVAHQEYIANVAEKKADYKKRFCHRRNKIALGSTLETFLLSNLSYKYSPEMLSRMIKRIPNLPNICHETIYKWIYSGDAKRYKAWQFLYRKQKKRIKNTGRKHYGIKDRVFIDKRPKEAGNRIEVGHFEGDTVLGTDMGKNVNLLTLVDMATRYLIAKKVKGKHSEEITKKCISSLSFVKDKGMLKTITVDNGTEFAGHKKIAKNLNLDIFFANPYSPNERGTNENRNGQIRHFFPKGTDFSKYSQKEIQKIVDTINDKPLKVLGDKSPRECFNKKMIELEKVLLR